MGRSDHDAYRRAARWYDRVFGGLNAGLRGLDLTMFPPRDGMEVLDVGCGTGLQLASYQHAGCRVSGIDASPAMLAAARRRLGDTAALRLGDAARLPWPDRAFDLVLASTVLHEMPSGVRVATLGEMRRVLRPGGRVLLTDFEAGPGAARARLDHQSRYRGVGGGGRRRPPPQLPQFHRLRRPAAAA
jgi:ubiquinone/menaquinone biosynthesis C-methylase UbiE